jgi:Ca2+-binding EF-hand superfamily protein
MPRTPTPRRGSFALGLALLTGVIAAGAAIAQTTTAAPARPAGEEVKAAFQRADANADGKLTKDEATRMPAIAERFDALDGNKDGHLDEAEFGRAFEAK